MSYDEKRTWIMLVVSTGWYVAYWSIMAGRVGELTGLERPSYAPPMILTIVGSILTNIVLSILAGVSSSRDRGRKDVRDREIHQFGQYVGQSFLVLGGVGGLVLALLRAEYFWISNTIYAGFVLSAVLASVAKIFAYRRGLPRW